MPTKTKNPSTTSAIVSGWNNPTYAYSEDGSNTTASPAYPNKPEQKYGGWGWTTSDIPSGSTITKVEMGAKHYETDPSGYNQYTFMRFLPVGGGGGMTAQLVKRSSLTWDWWDITSQQGGGWDLDKLNAADIRIISELYPVNGGGCYVETDKEKTYVLVKLDKASLEEKDSFMIKPVSELKIGEHILIWTEKQGQFFSPVAEIQEFSLKDEDVYETWSGTINIKDVTISKKDYIFTPHTTNTKTHPIPVYRSEDGKHFSGPIILTVEELHELVYRGERFWIGHLWYKWEIKMFPIVDVVRKRVTGRAYKVITKEKDCRIFTKSLKTKELEDLSKEGLTLEKQVELGPPFMMEISKTTSYVDVVAVRVTYTEPTTAKKMQGDGLTCVIT